MTVLKKPDTGSPAYKNWLIIFACGLFIIFAASMCSPAFPFYWATFYKYIYKLLAGVLMLSYLYFRRFQGAAEIKLCLAFCLWGLISRFLNGDFLLEDGEFIFNIAVSCMFLPLCMLLDEKKRSAFLDIFSLAVCVFFTFGAIQGIYTAITQKLIVNPFSQWYFCTIRGDRRLYLFDSNPNTVGHWMLISIGMLLYQFFKRKNIASRVLIILMFAVDYIAAALAGSRNGMLGLSFVAAAFVLMLLIEYLPLRKPRIKTAVIAAAIILTVPLTYTSFSGVRTFIGIAANSYEAEESAEARETEFRSAEKYYTVNLSASAENEEDPGDLYKDKRGFKDSGRLPIYKTAFDSIKEEPIRLLRGSLSSHTMDIARRILGEDIGHFHNSLLQVLSYAGLPGLLLVLAFFVLLAVRAAKLFFCTDSRAGLAIKSLAAILPGIYIYNMLETSAFVIMDFNSMAFFIIAGAVCAYSYEICPPKNKKA